MDPQNLPLLLKASHKMLLDKLQLSIHNDDILSALQSIIPIVPHNDDIKTYNKDILRHLLSHFSQQDTLDNAVLQLDLNRTQPVINIPSSSQPISNNKPIKDEPNFHISIPPTPKQFFSTFLTHSIHRDFSAFPSSSFFDFSLPTFSNIVPFLIISPFLSHSSFSLKISDRNASVSVFHFFLSHNHLFHTIDNLKPLSIQNNNLFTLGLYDHFDNLIPFQNILISSFRFIENNLYHITFNIPHFSSNFFLQSSLFTFQYDNTFLSNDFDPSTSIHPNTPLDFFNEFSILWKIIL